jgi:hypothetical protein
MADTERQDFSMDIYNLFHFFPVQSVMFTKSTVIAFLYIIFRILLEKYEKSVMHTLWTF